MGTDKEKYLEKRKVLNGTAKVNAIKLLLASETAARQFLDTLQPEDIASWNPGFAMVWRLYRDALALGSRPSRNVLIQTLRETAEDMPSVFTEDVVNETVELVRVAYRMKVTDDLVEKGISLCKRMVEESIYLAYQAECEIGQVPEDIPDFFAKINERVARSAPALLSAAGQMFDGEWWKNTKVIRRSSEVKVYDRILGGGMAGGWVAGFAAPFGGGKTSLVVRAACQITRTAELDAEGRKPIVAIFTFETPKSEFLLRFLSCYAGIPSKYLQEVGFEGLRTKNDPPQEYEKKMFAGSKHISEKGRAMAAAKAISNNVVLYDVSNMENDHATVQSISTIANCVRLLNTDTTYVHSVWIDHTSALVDHVIETSNGRYTKDDRVDLVRDLPRKLRIQVAKKYNVPVVLLAQLSGAANSRSPGAPMAGTDVEGCKSFGMYLDINVVSGKVNQDGYCAWYSDKNRHGPICPRLIVRFDGSFYQFSDATDHMTIEESTRTFISLKDAGKAGSNNPDKYIPTQNPQQRSNLGI